MKKRQHDTELGTLPQLRHRLAGVLDWSVVDKGILLLTPLVPVYVQYLCWGLYVLQRDDGSMLVDTVYAAEQESVLIGFIVGALAILALGFVLRQRQPRALWFQHLAAQYYSLTLIYCGYMTGILSFASGVVMVGAPLVGFILLEQAVVYWAWGLALAAVLLASFGSAMGLFSYAPLVVPPVAGDTVNQLFWTISTLFFAAPHMLCIMVLAHLVLGRWREREQAFRTMSFTDVLTGVHNRRSALDTLERELARARRAGGVVSVVLIDLDHFKRINDTWGHTIGDRVLQAAARSLRATARDYDLVGRLGGEEFLLVLPGTSLAAAVALAERCRVALQALTVRSDNGETLPVSGSFGVAGSEAGAQDATALVRNADLALYRAKQSGRNRVEVITD